MSESKTTPRVRFSIGDLVQHELFHYRGVVIGADPQFEGTDEWYETVARVQTAEKTVLGTTYCLTEPLIRLTWPTATSNQTTLATLLSIQWLRSTSLTSSMGDMLVAA